MENQKLPLGYVGGDIMSRGSQMMRQLECDLMNEANLNVEYYSPAQNKSINDKANMTEEENNHLAEKITEADIERLWNSDFTVMCPEQSAIGTLCETGCLFGWHYMGEKLIEFYNASIAKNGQDWGATLHELITEIIRIATKQNFFHYSDIRTNHLNEKDWRRSFSINQLLYGFILGCSCENKLYDKFEEIIPSLEKLYGTKENN